MIVKARYINPHGQPHTLTGKGGTKEAWKRYIKKTFGEKNIISIKFNMTNEVYTKS